jgi:hypothetical protein
MNATPQTLRVLASPVALWIGIAGLLVTALFSLDVPQGIPGNVIRATFPLSAGPYIEAFGLNHVGRSLVLWGFVLLLAGHGLARFAINRPSSTRSEPRRLLAGLAAAGIAIAALAFSGFEDRTPPVDDSTRLRVELPDGRGSRLTQTVEEGAAYEVQGADGAGTFLFGTADRGPYALERSSNGSLRAHLPLMRGGEAGSQIHVAARRPLANAPDQASGIPALLVDLIRLLAAMSAGWLWYQSGRSAASFDRKGRSRVVAASFVALVLFMANPWISPGSGMVPIGAGSGGEDVFHLFEARGTRDAATWIAGMPARVRWSPLAGLGILVALAGVVGIAVGMHGVRTPESHGTRSGTRGLRILAIPSLIAGTFLLAHALGRIPLAFGSDDLLGIFQRDILPRIPTEISVLSNRLSAGAPFTLPILDGLVPAIGFTCAGLAVLAMTFSGKANPRPDPPALPHVAIFLLLAAANALVLLSGTEVPWSHVAGSAPKAAISLLLAGIALVSRRLLGADRPTETALLVLAAGLQFPAP